MQLMVEIVNIVRVNNYSKYSLISYWNKAWSGGSRLLSQNIGKGQG